MNENAPALVLNVDDYDANRYFRTSVLRKAGYRVIEARGGAEALELVAAEHPDLVMLDVQMPDIDGLEVCRRVRANPDVASTLILQVSATAIHAVDVSAGLDNGADGYLSDGLNGNVILSTVRSLLRLRRAEQERNEARLRLEETEGRLARLMANLSDVVYRVQVLPHATVEYVSPAVFNLTGHTPDDFYRTPRLWRDLLDEADQARLAALRHLKGDQTSLVLHWSVGGRVVWTEHRVTVCRDERGRVYAIEGVGRDITSQREAEEELRQANRMKDEFLATLSHELRTPLNAIVGWSQMLQSRTLSPHTIERGLEAISRNALAQTRLINEVLDVSRIISGKLHLASRPFDLTSAIQAAVDAFRPAAAAKGLSLQVDVPHTGVPFVGDPDRLQQVFSNLLSNAVKFTGPGGSVAVSLQCEGDTVEVSVQDTGVGVPDWFLPHIFERFRQLDSSFSRGHSGLGLGLALVKHLVDLHEGSVRAESAGENQGTRFTVRLPVRAETPAVAAPTPASIDAAAGGAAPIGGAVLKGVRVLLVDDDDDGREAIAEVLALAGAEVTQVGGAQKALAYLQEAAPDVLISDLGMPLVDGLALIRQVRGLSESEGGRVPAIALTAYGRAEDQTLALRAGYQLHLSKPVMPRVLVREVLNVVGRNSHQVA